MAKPRIFISSTFYDLRHVREDIELFVKGLGYEPVRHETGAIPYGKDDAPESYAYREIELCDIIVTIVGGRFGSESRYEEGLSITQAELKRALDSGIQVFIFIDKSVLSEFSTYLLNRESVDIKYKFVDDKRIYEFIDTIHKLPSNNPITPFETPSEIIEYLRVQWAGLFQRFLQEQKRLAEARILDEMKSVSNTLQEMVKFFREERKNKDEAISNILLANHPAFRRLATIENVKYRVYFTNKNELDAWLSARGWKPIDEKEYDEGSVCEWGNTKEKKYLKLTESLFDKKGRLIILTEDGWNDEWLVVKDLPGTTQSNLDDLPF